MAFTKKEVMRMSRAAHKALKAEGAEIMWRTVEHGVDFPYRKPPYIVFRGLQINPDTLEVLGCADTSTISEFANAMLDYYFNKPEKPGTNVG
jgi:hypothetical protein